MKTRIIRIGNSRGVRIPKPILDQTEIGEEVELEVDGGRIVIRAAGRPRDGWADAFRSMAESRDDALIDPEAATRWDEEEWEW